MGVFNFIHIIAGFAGVESFLQAIDFFKWIKLLKVFDRARPTFIMCAAAHPVSVFFRHRVPKFVEDDAPQSLASSHIDKEGHVVVAGDFALGAPDVRPSGILAHPISLGVKDVLGSVVDAVGLAAALAMPAIRFPPGDSHFKTVFFGHFECQPFHPLAVGGPGIFGFWFGGGFGGGDGRAIALVLNYSFGVLFIESTLGASKNLSASLANVYKSFLAVWALVHLDFLSCWATSFSSILRATSSIEVNRFVISSSPW